MMNLKKMIVSRSVDICVTRLYSMPTIRAKRDGGRRKRPLPASAQPRPYIHLLLYLR